MKLLIKGMKEDQLVRARLQACDDGEIDIYVELPNGEDELIASLTVNNGKLSIVSYEVDNNEFINAKSDGLIEIL
jgi:hypothetical protein